MDRLTDRQTGCINAIQLCWKVLRTNHYQSVHMTMNIIAKLEASIKKKRIHHPVTEFTHLQGVI